MMRLLALVMLLALAAGGAARAQGITLWQVENAVTPTLVPAYVGQPSPFPAVKAQEVSATDPALEAVAQARLSALQKAEKLLASKDAFQPELGLVQVSGRLDGQAGPRILISNQWVGVGQRLGVKLTRSVKSQQVIRELREYDADAAGEIEGKLQQQLSKRPYLQMVVKSIGAKEIKLESEYGQHTVPIASSEGGA